MIQGQGESAEGGSPSRTKTEHNGADNGAKHNSVGITRCQPRVMGRGWLVDPVLILVHSSFPGPWSSYLMVKDMRGGAVCILWSEVMSEVFSWQEPRVERRFAPPRLAPSAPPRNRVSPSANPRLPHLSNGL